MRTLTWEIVSGARQPEEKLPREVDLAAEFDVSRGVARETIRALEERGLVNVKHGIGATVNPRPRWDIVQADVLAAVLDTGQSADMLGQYLECRRIMEVEAAGLAAERAHDNDLRAMEAAFAQMQLAARRPAAQIAEELFHEADLAFHQALIAATGNQALSGFVVRIHSSLLLARFALARPQRRLQKALPEHRRILDAVKAHDAAAAKRAMSDHLDTIGGYLDEYRHATADELEADWSHMPPHPRAARPKRAPART